MKNSKYSWFVNRDKVDFLNKTGYSLNTESLKIEILDANKKFDLKVNDKTYRIDAIGKCKVNETNKTAFFGISITRNKLFVLRLDEKLKYNSTVMYRRNDFLNLCTNINRKLKG